MCVLDTGFETDMARNDHREKGLKQWMDANARISRDRFMFEPVRVLGPFLELARVS